MAEAGELAAFERIRQYLQETRGFDFTAYKRASILRRTLRRMQMVGVTGFDAYLDYLQVHPTEFAALFNTILINVTSFFRDPDMWDVLRTSIVPQILAGRGDRPVRIWSAGCASGQEAYSAAILLAEATGLDAFRDRVKIYATDVDEEALTQARQAAYPASRVAEELPADLIDKYFDRTGDMLLFKRDLRRTVIFGRHDLLQDAPISRVDLLFCRNTLMYFNSEAQGRIMPRFYYSIFPDGFLVLGRAELQFSQPASFQPVDLKRRIFRALPRANHRERLLMVAQAARDDTVSASYPKYGRLREEAFDTTIDPQIVLDRSGTVVAVNGAARRQFNLLPEEIGVPFHDLELARRPAELRATLDRVREEGRDMILRAIPLEQNGSQRFLDIVLAPLFDDDRTPLGTRITFLDVTPIKTLQDELTHSKQELETAYEELQSTNEELETTNEELQSTVEELETTNEELQSTNEELETMNEELQSTNEELQTMNDELCVRSTELNSANALLESVFTSLRSAVVVLDREMRVVAWNAGASNLWAVSAEEAHRASFFTLDIGLPVGDLHQPIKDVLAGAKTHRLLEVPATTRKGKAVICRVLISPLFGGDRSVTGAILLIDEAVPA